MDYCKACLVLILILLTSCLTETPEISITQVETKTSWPREALTAIESCSIGKNSTIEGSVAVVSYDPLNEANIEDQLYIDSNSTVKGPVNAQSICIKDRVHLEGNVRAQRVNCDDIKKLDTNSVIYSPSEISLPVFEFIEPGSEKITIRPSEQCTLTSGKYGKVTLHEGDREHPAALTLSGGEYYLEELDIGTWGRLQCREPCDVHVMGRLFAGPSSFIGKTAASNANADDVRIYVGGFNNKSGELFEDPESFILGENSSIFARIYSPNSTLVIKDGGRVEGSVIARNIKVGNEVRVTGILNPQTADIKTRPVLKTTLERDTEEITIVDGEIRSFRINPSVNIDSRQIFSVYGSDLGLRRNDKMILRNSQKTGYDLIYYQFQQQYKGIPVLGTGYSVGEKNGRTVSAVGKIAHILDINTKPKFTENAALQEAMKAVGAELYEWETSDSKRPPDGTLAIASKDYTMKPGSFRLVYRFYINSVEPYGRETVDIDAHTGEVTGRFSNIVTAEVQSEGDTIFNGHQQFKAESFDDNGKTRYRLRVPKSAAQAAISTKQSPSFNKVSMEKDFVSDENKFNFFPLSSDSGGIILEPKFYGVTIHWGLQEVVKYWKQFNLKGVDKEGNVEIKALMIDNKTCNGAPACYLGHGWLVFGDEKHNLGEHVTLFAIGHEYTHAIYWQAAFAKGDAVVNRGETQIINEGFGNLFGWLVYRNEDIPYCAFYTPEHSLIYTNYPENNKCDPDSETCVKKYDATCYGYDLSNPKEYGRPDFYKGLYYMPAVGKCTSSNDYCHHNSSLIPYWFYLLKVGARGTSQGCDSYHVDGIGREKAEKIAVNALLYRLSGTANFKELREATIQAARDLYGKNSKEAVSVMNAWSAVGVGDKYDPRSYSPKNTSGVDPWPATLKWESLKGEFEWQVQISPDRCFKNEVKTLKPGNSFSQITVIGKPITWMISKPNLKPVTKYYWRVRSKRINESSIAFPLPPNITKGANKLWIQTGPKQIITTKGPMNIARAFAVSNVNVENWEDWGAVQEFVTGPKIPKIKSPGSNDNNYSGNSKRQDATAPKKPVIAKGKYYPWNTKFTWESLPGAKEYRLTVSEDPNKKCMPSPGGGYHRESFHSLVRIVPDDAPDGGTVKYGTALKNGKIYYWWLQAYGPEGIAGGCAYGGAPVKFKTSVPKAKLVSPADGAKVSPFKVTLEWKKVKGAAGYSLERAKGTPTFTGFDEVKGNTSSFPVSEAGKYYWRVTPLGQKFPPLFFADRGAVSGTRSFTADLSLTKPVLDSPEKNEYRAFGGDGVSFIWHPVEEAQDYKLTVYERNPNKSTGATIDLITSGYAKCSDGIRLCQRVKNVNSNKNGYCWKVTAIGPGGLTGADSDLWCYNIGASRPVIISPLDDQTGVKYSPTKFKWKSYYSPTGYRIRIYEHTKNSVDKITDKKLGKVEHYSKVLKPETEYGWHIINLNPNGDGASDGGTFITKKEEKPKETCKTLIPRQDDTIPSIRITYPPSWTESNGVFKPLYVSWQVNDPAIREYQIIISSVHPNAQPPQPFYTEIYTSDPIPSATVTSGNTTTYYVPIWIQNLNLAYYNITVSARTAGDPCGFRSIDSVIFALKLH